MDRAAIEDERVPGYTLMTRAAQFALDDALARFPCKGKWTFLCGGGNNAGDGYVMARLATSAGISVAVYWLSDPAALKGDAHTAYRDFVSAGLEASAFNPSVPPDAVLVIDAMLGSGIEREVSGKYREAVDWANRQPSPVLALDIPTGLNGDSGEVLGAAVRADRTVTFVGLKAGLVLGDGPDFTGELRLAGLDIPERCRAPATGVIRALSDDVLASALKPRARDVHKGLHGHVVVVGGAPGMSGAVRIAGEAALRSGAGLVSVVTHPVHAGSLNTGRPELMVRAVQTADDASPILKRADVIAIGPGLGTDSWAASLMEAALDSDRPLVIDADGLNHLAGAGSLSANAILTPHPGEAARMLGVSNGEIQGNRLAALSMLAEKYAATVILKGAGTLVSACEGPPWICLSGNPGMASPGMGDALTGIVAALWGQGLERELAAVVGAIVHARAGDAAAADGERGLLASDLVNAIRNEVNP